MTSIPVRISKFHASPEMLISDKQPPRAPPPWKLLITLVLQYYSIYKDFLKQNLSDTKINKNGRKGNLLHPLQKDHFFLKKKDFGVVAFDTHVLCGTMLLRSKLWQRHRDTLHGRGLDTATFCHNKTTT